MEFIMKLSITAFFNDYWTEDADRYHYSNNTGVKSRRHFLKRRLAKALRRDNKAAVREALKDIS